MKTLIYDLEIAKAILGRNEQAIPDIAYCDGWRDFEGMGLSIGCAVDWDGSYRMFSQDNLDALQEAIDAADLVIGYNILKFDNPLLRAQGITVPDEKCYDLLAEIWRGLGLDPLKFSPQTHGGLGLDAVAATNGYGSKTGNGAYAPVWWQRGEIGKLVDYCLRDVYLTSCLWTAAQWGRPLRNPKYVPTHLNLRLPSEVLADPIVLP